MNDEHDSRHCVCRRCVRFRAELDRELEKTRRALRLLSWVDEAIVEQDRARREGRSDVN